MVTKSEKASSQRIRLPQLVRILLIKLGVERLAGSTASEDGVLTSKIRHQIQLELLPPTKPEAPVRLRANVEIIGEWSRKGGSPVVRFSGYYESRFTFPPHIKFEMVDKWIEDSFFRDAVVAQAIPTINLHMYSQLEMMGLNPNQKKIGYEPKDEEWELSERSPVALPKPVKKRTVRRKKLQE